MSAYDRLRNEVLTPEEVIENSHSTYGTRVFYEADKNDLNIIVTKTVGGWLVDHVTTQSVMTHVEDPYHYMDYRCFVPSFFVEYTGLE